jgi:hypothetical protein
MPGGINRKAAEILSERCEMQLADRARAGTEV